MDVNTFKCYKGTLETASIRQDNGKRILGLDIDRDELYITLSMMVHNTWDTIPDESRITLDPDEVVCLRDLLNRMIEERSDGN